ncbi:MAG: carboxymuconolactone decarboxylase [Ginsengibacter sp.]
MSHIQLMNEQLPGIIGLFDFRPATAEPLGQLAEILLRGPSSLSSGEREIIASYVSWKNECLFCHNSHGASAAHHLGTGLSLIDDIKNDFKETKISPKLRTLLDIAGKVQKDGKSVLPEDIENAKEHGATDLEIHDTVLIAAAFCMYNRYVEGLGTWAPKEKEAYDEMGYKLAHEGYVQSAGV